MRNIDSERLKLLLTFKYLFEERNVNSAANRLSVTQSAVSKHLKKLREWFNDELFVRTAQGMEPTERATILISQVEHIIMQMEALDATTPFNSRDLAGYATIETTDEISRQITTPLLARFAEHAPKLCLRVKPLAKHYSIRELEAGEVDVVISVNWHAPEQLLQKRLCKDELVVLMDIRHPLAMLPLTTANYAAANHLLVAPLSSTRGYIDQFLLAQGYKRNIRLTVPTFNEIHPDLLGSGHIITLPRKVAERLTQQGKLTIKPLPFVVPAFNYYLFWHTRSHNSPKNQWLRQEILRLFTNHKGFD